MDYLDTENIFHIGNERRLAVVVKPDGSFWVDVVDKMGKIIGSTPLSNVDELVANYE